MEETEETKETEETIIYTPLPRKYCMEETKEISPVSLVSSIKIFRGAINNGLLGLLCLLGEFHIEQKKLRVIFIWKRWRRLRRPLFNPPTLSNYFTEETKEISPQSPWSPPWRFSEGLEIMVSLVSSVSLVIFY